jgi:hypothetical protein
MKDQRGTQGEIDQNPKGTIRIESTQIRVVLVIVRRGGWTV